jgi:uncharacterized membrane protein YraQ (UPF0718 family)
VYDGASRSGGGHHAAHIGEDLVLADTVLLVLELATLFFGVAFAVHIAQRWLGEERLRRWMGGTPVVSALKGIAVGSVTPFCTYSAIPMLVGLRRAGVPPAGYVAFIVAAPVLDPVLFGALVIIVGIEASIVYVGVVFSAALGLAVLAQQLNVERFLKPVRQEVLVGGGAAPGSGRDLPGCEAPRETPGCDTPRDVPDRAGPWRGLADETRDAGRGAIRLLRSMSPVLLIGVGLGVVIELVAPTDLVASIAGDGNGLAIPIAAGLGTPLYVNTGLFVPLADSLAAVGVGVGAIVALTIAGAGANIPEFVLLGKVARAPALLTLVGYVFTVAVVGGVLAQAVAG